MPRKSSRAKKPNKRYLDTQNASKSAKNVPLKNQNVKSADIIQEEDDDHEQIQCDISEEITVEEDNDHLINEVNDDVNDDNDLEYVPDADEDVDDEETEDVQRDEQIHEDNDEDYEETHEEAHEEQIVGESGQTHYEEHTYVTDAIADGSAVVLIAPQEDEEPTHELSQLPQLGLAPDLVIAEAVQVLITQYQCKFCVKRFDTIDKVKGHYLKRHFGQTLGSGGYAIKLMETDDGDELNDSPLKRKSETDTFIIQSDNDASYTVTKPIIVGKRSKNSNQLPNHLQIKLIPASDADSEMPRKRGRPRKYEERSVVNNGNKDPERQYACPFEGCEYAAKYRSNLWDHKKTHTGEKPYPCSWPGCNSRFTQAQQLKLHLRSHTGERPFACEWPGCTKKFSQKPGLKAHVRTHTGEKPFACDWPGCGWRFTLKGALTDHKRAVHEQCKSFLCEWPGCNKKFLQSCHLRKHMMSHADIKPYLCDWPGCEYRAVSMAYVTNHRKTHTGEKNFECEYPNCGKKFTKSSHVRRHQQRFHANEIQEIAEFEEDIVEY